MMVLVWFDWFGFSLMSISMSKVPPPLHVIFQWNCPYSM